MERFAFKGVASNLVTYLTQVVKMSNSSAAKMVNNWCGFTSMLPLLVAPVADSYWDTYSTIQLSSFLYASVSPSLLFSPFSLLPLCYLLSFVSRPFIFCCAFLVNLLSATSLYYILPVGSHLLRFYRPKQKKIKKIIKKKQIRITISMPSVCNFSFLFYFILFHFPECLSEAGR